MALLPVPSMDKVVLDFPWSGMEVESSANCQPAAEVKQLDISSGIGHIGPRWGLESLVSSQHRQTHCQFPAQAQRLWMGSIGQAAQVSAVRTARVVFSALQDVLT